MKKKCLSLLLSSAVFFSMPISSLTVMAEAEEETVVSENGGETAEEEDFLSKIQGSYIELFPEMSKEEYQDTWLAETGAIVGEDQAEETTDMLLGMCMSELYGQEAIDEYGDGSNGMAFNCYFLGGISEFTIEGDNISGTDEDGNEIFSHAYEYVETDENGFYIYQSKDADSGQFTFFSFAPDTMEETWHLEFRYSEDVEDLASWFEGNYAYWNAGAIASDYTDEEMINAIHLFATENLAGEE